MWIGRHPGDWLVVMGKKLLTLWNAFEIPDNHHYAFMRVHFLSLLWPLLTFALVYALVGKKIEAVTAFEAAEATDYRDAVAAVHVARAYVALGAAPMSSESPRRSSVASARRTGQGTAGDPERVPCPAGPAVTLMIAT